MANHFCAGAAHFPAEFAVPLPLAEAADIICQRVTGSVLLAGKHIGHPGSFFGTSVLERLIPIQRAYNELEGEGYIYSIHGKGSFAADHAEPGETRKRELREKIREMAAELRYLGASEEELLALIREVQS